MSTETKYYEWVKASEELPGDKDRAIGIIVMYKGNRYSAHYHRDNGQFDISHARQTITFTKSRHDEIEWLRPINLSDIIREAAGKAWEACQNYESEMHNYPYGRRGGYKEPNKETYLNNL